MLFMLFMILISYLLRGGATLCLKRKLFWGDVIRDEGVHKTIAFWKQVVHTYNLIYVEPCSFT